MIKTLVVHNIINTYNEKKPAKAGFFRFLIIVLLFCTYNIQAQTCTPDTNYTSPGIYPQSIPDALPNIAYEEIIHAVVPADTMIDYFTTPLEVIINYMTIDTVIGLPTGFDYNCNPSECKIPGGDQGCFVVYGTANSTQTGSYPLTIKTTTNGTFVATSASFDQNNDITNLSLIISGTTQLSNTDDRKEFITSLYPNPAKNHTIFELIATKNGNAAFSLYSLIGKKIVSQNIIYTPGNNQYDINLSNIKPGIYYYQISSNDFLKKDKLIIQY